LKRRWCCCHWSCCKMWFSRSDSGPDCWKYV